MNEPVEVEEVHRMATEVANVKMMPTSSLVNNDDNGCPEADGAAASAVCCCFRRSPNKSIRTQVAIAESHSLLGANDVE